jgi:tyrosyl-tRNA synthetase
MFGKIMSLKDEFIIKYFTLLTRVSMDVVRQYEKDLALGENPRNIKLKLAYEITSMYHSKKDADLAEEYFIKTFSKKEIPEDMPSFKAKNYDIISVLVDSKLVDSKSVARRTIEQGGVKVDGIVIKDVNYILRPNCVLQKGKISFIKIL